MSEEHPNLSLMKRLDLRNLDNCADLFAEDFVWHFFNPQLPDIQGDYAGVAGLKSFFGKLGAGTGGTFSVEPISVIPHGDELVIACVRDTMTLRGTSIEVDAVVVWRIVDGRITEAWDIPAVNTVRPQTS